VVGAQQIEELCALRKNVMGPAVATIKTSAIHSRTTHTHKGDTQDRMVAVRVQLCECCDLSSTPHTEREAAVIGLCLWWIGVVVCRTVR